MSEGQPDRRVSMVKDRRRPVARAAQVVTGRGVVGVLVLISIVMVTYLLWAQQHQVECNAQYNERSARADAARAEAADADRRALETMVRAVVEEPRGDERAALDRYLASLDETDRKRRENPVPPPPPDLCR